MMKSSTGLRVYGVKGCPSIAMTATASNDEVKEVISALGLRTPPVILTSSPIQAHIKFSVLRRPASNHGIDGSTTKDGVWSPGLMDLLMRIYLRSYIEDLENGKEPKRCIIFSRGINILADIHHRLMEMTNYRYRDCRDSPFVINHSSLLPVSVKVIAERSSEISLYLSSNKMLLGIDIPNIDVIIFVRPYDQVSALIQGGGRGGRKLASGKRRKVQVYQLYNAQDLGAQNKAMSNMMRNICRSKECTRSLLKNYFVGCDDGTDFENVDPSHCCHNCDQRSSSFTFEK